MDVDAINTEERRKLVNGELCFICKKPGHYARTCKQRTYNSNRQHPSNNRYQKYDNKAKDKKRMNPKDLHVHMREMILEHIGDDEEALNDFLDEVEEKGF